MLFFKLIMFVVAMLALWLNKLTEIDFAKVDRFAEWLGKKFLYHFSDWMTFTLRKCTTVHHKIINEAHQNLSKMSKSGLSDCLSTI